MGARCGWDTDPRPAWAQRRDGYSSHGGVWMTIPMKNRFARLAGATAGVLAFATTAFAADRELRVFNWSDYIDESILEDFTKETGIKVTYDVFDSNEVLETKLLAGKTGYDIVVPTGAFLSRQIEAGVFQKLDKSKLTNIGNVWPEIAKRTEVYDPGNEHAITYMWGTTGIGYNEAKVKERMPDAPVNSWDLVFKPEIAAKFKDCGIFMLDSPDDILTSALRYLGIDPNTKNAEDLKKGADLLKSVRANVQKFHSSEYINALANGDICIAIGWSGDILQARDRAVEAKNGHVIKYAIPKEGAMMWFDMMAIPKDAKNVAEAHEFLNYLLKPEVIAKASNYINYANGNLASKEFVSDEVKNDTAIYPDDATMANLFVKLAYDAKTQRSVTRLWTGVVTGK
jgi:putrescine transport system substrate-binding protein